MKRATATLFMLFVSVFHGGCTATSLGTANQEFARASLAQPIGRLVAVGDFLIVRGVLQDCPAWVGRLLAAPEVPNHGNVTLFGEVSVNALGRWPNEIRDSIMGLHRADFPNQRPPRLTVEVVSAQDFKANAEEVAHSLSALYLNSCPQTPPPPPEWWGEVERHDSEELPPSDDISPLFKRLG
jgi:hypothetical protein